MSNDDEYKFTKFVDKAALYQSAAPHAENVVIQQKVLNKDKAAGVKYKCCADVSRKKIQIASSLIGSEALYILSVVATMYSYRFHQNRPMTPASAIKSLFDMDLVDYPVDVYELARRYAMRENYLQTVGVPDPNKFRFDHVNIAPFVDHLRQHGRIQSGGSSYYLWLIDDYHRSPILKIQHNIHTLTIMQFLNSMGQAVQNMEYSLAHSIGAARSNAFMPHKRNAFRFSYVLFIFFANFRQHSKSILALNTIIHTNVIRSF